MRVYALHAGTRISPAYSARLNAPAPPATSSLIVVLLTVVGVIVTHADVDRPGNAAHAGRGARRARPAARSSRRPTGQRSGLVRGRRATPAHARAYRPHWRVRTMRSPSARTRSRAPAHRPPRPLRASARSAGAARSRPPG